MHANNFVYEVIRRSDKELSKKSKALNKGFIIDENKISNSSKDCEERITNLNEKINSIKNKEDNKSY